MYLPRSPLKRARAQTPSAEGSESPSKRCRRRLNGVRPRSMSLNYDIRKDILAAKDSFRSKAHTAMRTFSPFHRKHRKTHEDTPNSRVRIYSCLFIIS